jgi:hypothetical protein
VMAAIDAGRPCPLGLVMVKSLLPTDLGHNHQVLAYAYQLQGGIATIWVYDPNSSGRDDITIRFDLSDAGNDIPVTHNVNASGPIYTFFVTPYEQRQPYGGRARQAPGAAESSGSARRTSRHISPAVPIRRP